MQRPPGRIGPILSRSPNAWIAHLNERHNAFAALAVTIDERGKLESRLVKHFIDMTLQLEQFDGADTSDAGGVEPAINPSSEPLATASMIAHLTTTMRDVFVLARSADHPARLTPELLITLGGTGLRTRDDHPGRLAAQVPAAYLKQTIETACDWFAADSFAELNPIEQAAIVFLRLLTIQPFEQANQATALVAASLFTLRATLPPVVIRPALRASFRRALVEADHMNMKPLVEVIAEAANLTLDEMIEWVKQARGERG